jgi:outer membrane protein TolC
MSMIDIGDRHQSQVSARAPIFFNPSILIADRVNMRMRTSTLVLGVWLSLLSCLAQEPELPPPTPLPAQNIGEPPAPLAPPPGDPCLRALPINLAVALKLVDSRPMDVALAAQRIRIAAAQLEQANVLWVPTMTIGGDYNRHDGPIQQESGTMIEASRGSWMFGVGSGILNGAIIVLDDAIFGPLVARQNVAARKADLQTATNDTMVAVTDAYFTVEQARGQLAGALDVVRRSSELTARVRKLAPGLAPELEVLRAEAQLAQLQETVSLAAENWQTSSAQLVYVLRLDPTAQVVPQEPPHLQVTLVDLNQPVDGLVELGLLNRPELASYQAQVKATLAMLKQEKFRPLIPSVLIRGWSTPVAGTLGYGIFAGGTNSSINNTGSRVDVDAQLLWQLNNLGFGNRAMIHQRKAELEAITLQLFKMQDRVAADVAQAYSQARNARHRAELAEREVKLALESYQKNLLGLEQTRRVGAVVQVLVRPQEAVAALQTLAQSYINYYLAVADSNRAQFRLYRAIGQPAQVLGASAGTPEAPQSVPCPPSSPP